LDETAGEGSLDESQVKSESKAFRKASPQTVFLGIFILIQTRIPFPYIGNTTDFTPGEILLLVCCYLAYSSLFPFCY
jgi:hypothetical protein